MTVDQCQYGCAELGYSLAGVTFGDREWWFLLVAL